MSYERPFFALSARQANAVLSGQVGGIALRVYMALFDAARWGPHGNVSVRTLGGLCKATGERPSAVETAISLLVGVGWVERAGDGRYRVLTGD